ncbi:MAG: GDSL-type esterase/lipase family protein [Actinomycetota bacterium]|nr:GDSL-type esterase/lipase family protein [Actinomycetota bacterium]
MRTVRAITVGLLASAAVATACGSSDSAADPTTTSAAPTTTAAVTTTAAEASTGPITIMPLGDSLTAGDDAEVATQPQSYRGYLHAMLTEAGYDVDMVGSQSSPAVGDLADDPDPDHEGHGGFTIGPDESALCDGCQPSPANLSAHVEEWLATPPDVILLMAGVNDMLPEPEPTETGYYRPVDPADAAGKLGDLVDQIAALAPDSTIVVGSYPPIGFLVDMNNPALAEGAEAFADLNQAAADLGAADPDDDIFSAPIRTELDESWSEDPGAPDSDVIGDGLHPSPQGAEKIAEVWFDTLTPILDQLA